MINTKEIIYLKGERNYTHCFLKDGSKIMLCKTLKDVLYSFAEQGFFRIHKGYGINLNYVKYIDKNCVIMDDGAHIPISRKISKKWLKAFFSST